MAGTQPVCRNLVVIGIGLIGGSLAKAARERGLCQYVIGIARKQDTCDKAVELGIVDRAYTQLSAIAATLSADDIIFISVPTLSVRQVLADIHTLVNPMVTITDGASVKGSVLEDVKGVYNGSVPPQFVPGHPIAGSEQSGVTAANSNLYEDHRVILTPLTTTGADHLAMVERLWRGVGAEVLQLTVEEHDEILGATSHLPHAIAFSLVDTLAHDSQNVNIFRYAAGGFRDFTRIASSDAVMWRDIMLANRASVLKSIDLFSTNLAKLRSAIDEQNADELQQIFSRAKTARDEVVRLLEPKQGN